MASEIGVHVCGRGNPVVSPVPLVMDACLPLRGVFHDPNSSSESDVCGVCRGGRVCDESVGEFVEIFTRDQVGAVDVRQSIWMLF